MMNKNRKYNASLLLLIALCITGLSQRVYGQNAVTRTPDCVVFFNWTGNGAGTQSTAAYDNRFQGCDSWTVNYAGIASAGSMTGLTVQSAPVAAGGVAGTWATYAGTVIAGINPNTNNTGRITYFENGLVAIPFIRVLWTEGSFVGNLYGVLYGWRTQGNSSASMGAGCEPMGAAGEVLLDDGAGGCTENVLFTWDAVNYLTDGVRTGFNASGQQDLVGASYNVFGMIDPAPTVAMTAYGEQEITTLATLWTGDNVFSKNLVSYAVMTGDNSGAYGFQSLVENRGGTGNLLFGALIGAAAIGGTTTAIEGLEIDVSADAGTASAIGLRIRSVLNATISKAIQTADGLVEFGDRLLIDGIIFSGLNMVTDGMQRYCSDCTVTSPIDDTCAGSGSGAYADRINGVNRCRI